MELSASALSFSPPLASLPSPPCTPRPPTLTLAISRVGGDQEGTRTGGGRRAWCRDLRAQPHVVEVLPHGRKPLPPPPVIPGRPQPASARPPPGRGPLPCQGFPVGGGFAGVSPG